MNGAVCVGKTPTRSGRVMFPEERPKPDGGFVFVSPKAAMAVYQALGTKGLRTWLASHELAERRKYLESGRKPSFQPEELTHLLGGGGEGRLSDLKRILRALEERSLLRIRRHSLAFPKSSVELSDEKLELLKGIPARVPIPRRMLVQLSGCSKKSLLLTALGHLFRSMRWYSGNNSGNKGVCKARGRAKAVWVAELFGISEKSVYRARTILLRDEWFIPVDSQGNIHHGPTTGIEKVWENEWGKNLVVNLFWSPDPVEKQVGDENTELPVCQDPPRLSTTRLSGPYREQRTSPKVNNPELEQRSSPGVYTKVRQVKPSIDNVRTEDLKDLSRTIRLGKEAWERKWIEHDPEKHPIRVVSLARKALTYASDPPAFFRRMLERDNFGTICQADEDWARDAINRWQWGSESGEERQKRQLVKMKQARQERANQTQAAMLKARAQMGEKLLPSAYRFLADQKLQEEIPSAGSVLNDVLGGLKP